MEKKFICKRALSTKSVVMSGLLVSISVILTRFFYIMLPIAGISALRITFGSIPIMISGILFGPVAGFLTGVVSDLLGCLINPMGVYFIGFTISAGLEGAIPGLIYVFIKRRKTHINFNIFNIVFILSLSISFVEVLFLKNVLTIKDNIILYDNNKLPLGIIILFIAAVLTFLSIPIIFNIKYKDRTKLYSLDKILFCVTVTYFIVSLILNTLWLSIMYNKAFMIFLPGRVLSGVIMIPIYALTIFGLSSLFKRVE